VEVSFIGEGNRMGFFFFVLIFRFIFVFACQDYYIYSFKRRLATGWLFSPGTPVSFTNKTDLHDIAEILLKVAVNTIKSKQTDHFPGLVQELQ
jgi:hypothetical protein